ncbi:MAG: cytochrome c biogenesis protein CcdA, partial [Actinobacteria bacterium]|nr:cytochrome c biogenesis protein CcdA [Actinomycetota bacterium]
MNLSLSFITGMIASINPCGFVLLPTYLMYFLGVSATDQESQRAPIRR